MFASMAHSFITPIPLTLCHSHLTDYIILVTSISVHFLCSCSCAAECARRKLLHHIGSRSVDEHKPSGHLVLPCLHCSFLPRSLRLLLHTLYFSHIHVSYSQPLPFSLTRNDEMRTSMSSHHHTYHLTVSVPELLAPCG